MGGRTERKAIKRIPGEIDGVKKAEIKKITTGNEGKTSKQEMGLTWGGGGGGGFSGPGTGQGNHSALAPKLGGTTGGKQRNSPTLQNQTKNEFGKSSGEPREEGGG